MKKTIIFLLIGLFLCVSNAFSLTLGHDYESSRENVDSWEYFTIVDNSLHFDTDGFITGWNIYAQQKEETFSDSIIYFQSFQLEDSDNDEYKLTNSYEYTVTSPGENNIDLSPEDFMEFHKKAYIGWTFTTPTIGYDSTGGNVDWPANEGEYIVNEGKTFQFGGTGGSRTYSISAEYQPVPEPTAMLLFGTGLLGLAGFGRKKFFKKTN